VIGLAPRAPGDSLRPRRLSGVVTRPLNFTVRERMSRQCPACRTAIPIWRWRGPLVKYHRKPGTSWLRFTPEHLYCRNCGVEVRRTLLPLGRMALVLMVAWGVAANLAVFTGRSWGSLNGYKALAVILWVPLCVALSFIMAVWGTHYRTAEAGAKHADALSNNRSRGP
jgi:hypothetical protein